MDERVEFLKARLNEEVEFICIKCNQTFQVKGRSLWAPYTCINCLPASPSSPSLSGSRSEGKESGKK